MAIIPPWLQGLSHMMCPLKLFTLRFLDVNHLTSQQIKIIRELVVNMNQSTEKT